MAATVKGTAHLYGVSGTITSASVMSFNMSQGFALEDATPNESGVIIERRYDDITNEGSIVIRIQSGYSIPVAGDQITYETVKYEITKVDRVQEAKGFRTVTLSIKNSSGITLT